MVAALLALSILNSNSTGPHKGSPDFLVYDWSGKIRVYNLNRRSGLILVKESAVAIGTLGHNLASWIPIRHALAIVTRDKNRELYIIRLDRTGAVSKIDGPLPTDPFADSLAANPANDSIYVCSHHRIVSYSVPAEGSPIKTGSANLNLGTQSVIKTVVATDGRTLLINASDHAGMDASWIDVFMAPLGPTGELTKILDPKLHVDRWGGIIAGKFPHVYVCREKDSTLYNISAGQLVLKHTWLKAPSDVMDASISPRFGLISTGDEVQIHPLASNGSILEEASYTIHLPEKTFSTCSVSEKQGILYTSGWRSQEVGGSLRSNYLRAFDLRDPEKRQIGRAALLDHGIYMIQALKG
jgi:hypothetical protein